MQFNYLTNIYPVKTWDANYTTNTLVILKEVVKKQRMEMKGGDLGQAFSLPLLNYCQRQETSEEVFS